MNIKTTLPVLFLIISSTTHAYYQAEQGRWMNRDPSEEWGGFNLYGFVSNSPIMMRDDLGMRPEYTGPVPPGNQSAPNYPTPTPRITPKAPGVGRGGPVTTKAGGTVVDAINEAGAGLTWLMQQRELGKGVSQCQSKLAEWNKSVPCPCKEDSCCVVDVIVKRQVPKWVFQAEGPPITITKPTLVPCQKCSDIRDGTVSYAGQEKNRHTLREVGYSYSEYTQYLEMVYSE